MIPIDFSVMITLYLSIGVVLVIAYWIFYNCDAGESLSIESNHLYDCPFCTYMFFDYDNSLLKICPRCESYVDTKNNAKEAPA